MYQKIVDMNDILRKSDVESRLDYQLLFGKGAHAPRNVTREWRKSSLCLGLITSHCSGKEPALLGEEQHERAAEIEPSLC